MESLLFLLAMLGLIIVGSALLLLRAREPKGEYRGITSDGLLHHTTFRGLYESKAAKKPRVTKFK